MTDKEQIIIDGVNVKDCRRRIGKNSYCRYFKRLCSENNFNCIWKQLARKTQECEQYKKRAVCFKDVNKQLGYKYLTIKQECEELKEENQQLRNSLSDSLMFRFTSQDKETNRYRKALEEIKDITQNHIINDFSNWNMGEISDDIVADYVIANCKQILDIINEVKGEINE